jgi:hypothetical protein
MGMANQRRDLFERKGKLGEDDEKLRDYAYWAALGDEAKFSAAWDLVVLAYEVKGRNPDELRFQRNIEKLSRFPG